MARAFTSTLELPALIERIGRLITEHLQIPWFSLMLLREDGRLEVKSAFAAGQGTEGMTLDPGEGVCGQAAQSHGAVMLDHLHQCNIT